MHWNWTMLELSESQSPLKITIDFGSMIYQNKFLLEFKLSSLNVADLCQFTLLPKESKHAMDI